MCCIQETHLKCIRYFIRGYEIFLQNRENRIKRVIITLVRDIIPGVQTESSGQADLDTEYLGVKLVPPDGPVTVFNVYSPSDRQLQLDAIPVDTNSWIIIGDFNSHSPSWGYLDLDRNGEDLENWTISNQLNLINKPDDPPTCYFRAWRTSSTPDVVLATDYLHSIANREVCDQLRGSDHKPVIITLQKYFDIHSSKLPPRLNYNQVA